MTSVTTDVNGGRTLVSIIVDVTKRVCVAGTVTMMVLGGGATSVWMMTLPGRLVIRVFSTTVVSTMMVGGSSTTEVTMATEVSSTIERLVSVIGPTVIDALVHVELGGMTIVEVHDELAGRATAEVHDSLGRNQFPGNPLERANEPRRSAM